MKFQDIKNNKNIYLYCGDLPIQRINFTKLNFIGLSLYQSNNYHINHDITKPFELYDNSVDIVQSEDVMEHIEFDNLTNIINDIYRILKVNGLFRLSLPDYRCDILDKRSLKNINGDIYFDGGGGGNYDYDNKKVINGGHLWFPKYEIVKKLLETTEFKNSKIDFLHYYDCDNNTNIKNIDYSLGFIHRTPDNDERVKNPRRPMSIVVDCWKIK